MRALVLEGGAMRGIFTAGVLDAFVEVREPPYDLIIGVSAGACCAASFLSRQVYRNYVIFTDFMTTRAFANPARMLWGGSAVDMDFLMGPVTYELYPLDIEAMCSSEGRLEAVATNAKTGEAAYLPAKDADCVTALHATVAMPFYYRGGPISFRSEDYFDGAVSDPVPFERALSQGATEITVVLTRPRDWSPSPMSAMARLVLSRHLEQYPKIFERLSIYAETQLTAHDRVSVPPPGVEVRVISPPDDFPVDRFTQNAGALHKGYEMGRREVLRSL